MIISIFVVKTEDGERPLVSLMTAEEVEDGLRWAQQEANEDESDGWLFQSDTEFEDTDIGEEVRLVREITAV